MITPINSGGILLSYKCNSRCRHCLYGCGPHFRKWLPVEDARRIFEGIRRTAHRVRGIHLAGGEPFLNFPRLLAVLRVAVEHCIPIEYVETNAGWCRDEADAKEKFRLLRDSGLDAILISSSPFHAEYVPVQRLLTGIKAALEVFGPDGVIVWIPQFLRQLVSIDTHKVVPLDKYVSHIGYSAARRMIATDYNIIAGGRAGEGIGEFFRRSQPESFLNMKCNGELLQSGHAHFDPWCNVIPTFCSGISLGDGRELPSLIQKGDIDKLPLVRTLAFEGLQGLYRLARRDYDFEPDGDGYVDKCHLCYHMRAAIAQKTRKYKELAPHEFYAGLAKPGRFAGSDLETSDTPS